jgi:hypothetical protein
VSAISQRRFTHAELWAALDPIVRSPALRTSEIGRSIQGRPIRAITFGTGPTTVLLWSQMHGDESTATMALTDLLTWMTQSSPLQPELRDRIAKSLTVVMVPMLNPDGAEIFQRENAVGVDVNRDAAKLATPEARALKALRDSIKPQFGFNLHDQGGRILSGRSGRQVGIALLAPAANETADYSGARAKCASRRIGPGVDRRAGDSRPSGEVRGRVQSTRVRRPDAVVGHEHGADRERCTAERSAEAEAP